MDISVIVPIYKGNKYISFIQQMVNDNVVDAKKNGLDLQVELIFVNDYPDEPLVCDKSLSSGYKVKIIENDRNSGIHKTRVNGLLQASGSYILFLDQDDEISKNCLYSQYDAIGNNDIVVGNGYREINGKYKKIYRSIKKQKLSCVEKYFIKAANQIVSPGHCLIKRESIPNEWYEYIITNNGGDDLFLWLLMFENKKKFCINQDCIYKHIDTGINLSSDLKFMYKSSDNIIRISRICGVIPEKKIGIYERRIRFLRKMQSNSKVIKVLACITNFDICISKVCAYYK